MKKLIPTTLMLAALTFTACNAPADKGGDADEKSSENAMPEVPAVPDNASVHFVNLQDSATVTSPVYVAFGIKGMEVEPAGKVNEGKGHHHIIIDGEALETGGTVPADDHNIHYGGGQTSDSLKLSPGMHTLTMQFADGMHRSYGMQMATTITVNVVEEVKEASTKKMDDSMTKKAAKKMKKTAEEVEEVSTNTAKKIKGAY